MKDQQKIDKLIKSHGFNTEVHPRSITVLIPATDKDGKSYTHRITVWNYKTARIALGY